VRALLKRQPKWWRAASEPHGTKVLKRLGIDRVAISNVSSRAAVKWLASLNLDLIVVAGFDQILKPQVFDLPRLGAINSHPSLLPRYAGPAPVFWTIRNGERETGVTVHMITATIDGGDIIARKKIAIEKDETGGHLKARLEDFEPEVIADAADMLERGEGLHMAQDRAERSYHRMPRDEDKTVNWAEPAADILNLLHALQPDEALLTSIDGVGVSIGQAKLAETTQDEVVPGTIVFDDRDQLVIGTGQGCLSVSRDAILPLAPTGADHQPMDLDQPGSRFGT
jgi:methionyl-tRNA formyltransferase